MPCYEKENEICETCKYSVEGSITCHSPLIQKNPPEDAEWEPKDNTARPEHEL